MQTKKFLILDTTRLANKADYDAKISQIESKVPSITGLVTTSPLTAVENKIPDVSKLVKKQQNMIQKQVRVKVNVSLQLITINVLEIVLPIK